MRRTIKFEPDYQHIAILFNSNADIIPLASTLNKLTHSELTHTGELSSYDDLLEKELQFVTFSHEDKVTKTTMFLIKNRTEFTSTKSTQDLFSHDEEIVQRFLIGSKNSLYSLKSLINFHYCIILSFPLCQHKPANTINRIKGHPQIINTIELDFNNHSIFSDLSQEIELYINEYNQKCQPNQSALKRNELLSKSKEVKKEASEKSEKRIYYKEF